MSQEYQEILRRISDLEDAISDKMITYPVDKRPRDGAVCYIGLVPNYETGNLINLRIEQTTAGLTLKLEDKDGLIKTIKVYWR